MKTPQLDVDFSDPAMVSDPFPMFEKIRSAGRVVWNGAAQAWMVTGYGDCTAMLTDTKAGKAARFSVAGADGLRPDVNFWFQAKTMSITEGADHRRLRGPLARHFTASTLVKHDWESRVRAVVDRVLTPLVQRGDHFDLEDFTKIPAIVIAALLGVPEDRHEDFRRWSITFLRGIAWGNETPEAHRAMQAVIDEVNEYLSSEIERHRRDRPDDLLTVMTDITDWTDAEIQAVALNLVLGGYDTTAKLLGSALLTLQQHPEQRSLLADDPSLIPNAVEEVLRCQNSAQAIVRIAVEDTKLAGTRIEKGEAIYPILSAANRDPSRWADPQRFDIRRELKPNLSFAAGPHICLAAPLARLEVRLALEGLLAAAPDYRLRDVDYGDAFFARGPVRGVIDVGVPAAV